MSGAAYEYVYKTFVVQQTVGIVKTEFFYQNADEDLNQHPTKRR